MTKKDYILIAQAIKDAKQDIVTMFGEAGHQDEQQKRLVGVQWVAERLTVALAKENPRFDITKFVDYINKAV